MDYHLKRTRELQDFDKLIDPLGNVTKKQKNGGKTTMSNNDDDKEESDHQRQLVIDSVLKDICVEKRFTKEKGRTTETCLEINRLRAREGRKRKKKIFEDMQKHILLLTIKNTNLRKENQTQQQEITMLLKNSQSLLSNHRPLTRTSVSPTRIIDSEILKILSGVENMNDNLSNILLRIPRQPENIAFSAGNFLNPSTNDNLSDILRTPRQPENISFNDGTFLHPSKIDLGHRTLQSSTYPFGS